MTDVLMLTLCAVIADCSDFEEIEDYGRDKEAFLRNFLELPNGIPSHDTLNRIFRYLNPDQLANCLSRWGMEILGFLSEKGIQIDGKECRGTTAKGKKHASVQMVSAWVGSEGLCLAQQRVNSKSNEITAIPQVLSSLDIEGAIVSIDAMGCQQEIASQIIEQKGDYILALKKNHRQLQEEVGTWMEMREQILESYHERDLGHGRAELRQVYVSHDLRFIDEAANWEGMASLAMVKTTRWEGEKCSQKTRFYISSLNKPTAQQMAKHIRGHWSIENNLHWQLDMTFNEDASKAIKDNAPENLNTIRKMALQLLSRESSYKASMKRKRKKAARDDNYLMTLLSKF